jgi:hypothetical protein
VNVGDSSGSPTFSANSGSWGDILVEILPNSTIPGDYYANGSPSQALIAGPPAPAPIIIARGTPY